MSRRRSSRAGERGAAAVGATMGAAIPARRGLGRRALRWLLLLVLLAVLAAAGAAAVALAMMRYTPSQAMQALGERSPVEMIGHAYRRLEGHPRLERVLHPPLL